MKAGAALLALAVLAAGGAGLWKASLHWRRETALRATRTFLQRHETERAALSLRQALGLGLPDAETCRVAAELCEAGGSPQALAWRKRALSLQSGSASDRCLLARAAIRAGDLPLAGETLQALPPNERKGVEFHQAAGELAWARREGEEAAGHWAELVRFQPGKPAWKLNLATAQLLSADPAVAAGARQQLQTLRAVPELQLAALRTLVEDARIHPPATREERELLLRDFAAAPHKSMADQLLVLDSLHDLGHPDLAPYLARLQESIRAEPGEVAALMSWMDAHDLAAGVIAWEKTLPAGSAADPAIAFATAEALVRLGDWPALSARLAQGDWKQLEFVRGFLQAHAWRETGDLSGAEEQLETVVRSAARAPADLQALLQLSRRWHWELETGRLAQAAAAH